MAVDVLVTGAAGVLGREITQVLRSADYEVIACGRTPGDQIDARWDISCQDGPQPDCQPAVVVHAAAQTGLYGQAMEGTIAQFDVNVTGTLRVVRWCSERNVKRLILISGAVVYGQWAESPKSESDAVEPWWAGPYAVSKWASEGVASLFAAQGGQVAILRLTSLYGEGYQTGLIPRFIEQATRTGSISLEPPFDDAFDLLHVKDAARAVRSAVANESAARWNVGSGSLVTIHELAKICANQVNASIALSDTAPSRGQRITNWVNDTKARRELGHANSVSLEQGVSEIIQAMSRG